VSREEKDEVFPRSLIMRACFPGHWIEFGAGGFEPHELKASRCAGETWCVLITRLMGEHSWSLSLGQMLGGQGKRRRGRLHIATITRLRLNRMHSQLMHPQLLRLPLQRRWPGRRLSLPGFSGPGRKSHSSHTSRCPKGLHPTGSFKC